ncbi:unnamed protein product [Trichogramma brassicae]|uniref:Uncharacterized protein n=1 Tax=Trichogramma brassicae TaxID=86971 RepID=A0A6H5IZZ4_9HYME|nr:unnamed protein product [Trichogramma brassicae]
MTPPEFPEREMKDTAEIFRTRDERRRRQMRTEIGNFPDLAMKQPHHQNSNQNDISPKSAQLRLPNNHWRSLLCAPATKNRRLNHPTSCSPPFSSSSRRHPDGELNKRLDSDHDGPEEMEQLQKKYTNIGIMTSVDLRTSYWQVLLHPQSRLQASRNCNDYERRRQGTDTESTRRIKKNCYHGQISKSGPIAEARHALEKERTDRRAELEKQQELSQAVTKAQIRARLRLKATEEKFAREEQLKSRLKQEYTNQWIARSFGTIAQKLPEEKFKRPQFPTCQIPVDDVLQIHVERWDRPL